MAKSPKSEAQVSGTSCQTWIQLLPVCVPLTNIPSGRGTAWLSAPPQLGQQEGKEHLWRKYLLCAGHFVFMNSVNPHTTPTMKVCTFRCQRRERGLNK